MVVEEILEKLQLTLNIADFNTAEFENLLESLIEQEKVKLKILDFEYYNEERLEHAKKEKIEGVKSQNFEWAASWRDKEKKILKYIELREEFDIKKSGFHYEEGFLLYFYLGTEKNDIQIKELIKQRIKNSQRFTATHIAKPLKKPTARPKLVKECVCPSARALQN